MDLLLPGPQPPLSHFGVTLLRHVVVTGLRYSLYHLDLPLPDRAPTRIRELRLSLDPAILRRLLDGTPAGLAVLEALVEPGGVAGSDEHPPAGAAFFHRQRLRWARRRRPFRPAPPTDRPARELERHFREQLSSCLPDLNDAVLDEVLGALERRARRRRPRARTRPCLGAQAAAWAAGRRARLDCLGPPDAFVASWAAEGAPVARPDSGAAGQRHPGRGRFRESYRRVLDGLRPTLLALGRKAHERGVAGHPDDLFFLPFELLGDLTGDEKPPWLEGAILRNRGEYFGLLRGADPATRARWAAAPLHPLA